jgi:hypothetical protein
LVIVWERVTLSQILKSKKMKPVTLKSIHGGLVGEFDLAHAQAIFDLQKLNPPASWRLDDPNFSIENGKIILNALDAE